MGVTVYADVLFLINFSMDFLCFYIVARLRHRELRPARTAAASALGGAYSVAALFLPGGAVGILCDAAALAAVVAAAGSGEAGEKGTVLPFLRAALWYSAVCTVTGGVMTALYGVLDRLLGVAGGIPAGADGGDDLSVWLFALLAAAGGAAALVGGKRAASGASVRTADVIISNGNERACLRGLCDTGDLLTDPLSGRGVLVCELDAVRRLFPETLNRFWEHGDVSRVGELPGEEARRLRFIPAAGALSGNCGILSAIAADRVELVDEDGRSVRSDLLVAPVPRKICRRECRALFPAGIL